MLRGSFSFLLSAFNTLVVLFLLAPLIVVIISSFGATDYLRFPPRGFSFDWYIKAAEDNRYWRALWTSVYVGVAAALAATVLGFLAAWALVRHRVPGGDVLQAVFMLPLTLPHLVLGIAFLVLTQPLGLGGTIWRLAFAHVIVTIPFVLRVLMPVVAQLSTVIEQAAADLGANKRTILSTITIPLLIQPLVTAFLLAFIISFDELSLSLFLAPPSQYTLPLQIYSNVEFTLDATVGAVSAAIIAITLAAALLAQKLGVRDPASGRH